ncbi:hypothetical protein CH64_2682 [Yersinia rohdei]|uniref:Protein of uncharacterized function (DUF1454) n=1 Tax=Yersinia rohdei TaxID=29485 RepID=A0A0U1HVM7_YERRO|nr:DUF1454 family protein [Yersinia rohdei]AJJ10095.1 hypothetical protein CH64_2682 [Yersinia rohdei]EEQ03198.1 hypothetical protein yrohd0001_10920 [Yersinia rohdei ATCC 43380]MDN0094129.1 DUF1454 family protein [Yersinia rohdei]CNE99600.1 Protein of uncharacterised function (DUF1454) [Yersinia rohdei]CQI93963.1 Protein of uncharacterised function (DUF1454) [Yersinia rohdei]
MRNEITAMLAILLLIATVSRAHADPTDGSAQPTEEAKPTAPYLLSGAPTFELTLVKFRERYNHANPALPISEFHAISVKDNAPPLTRAASKINENLYASTALEKGTGKIKTLQITYLPIKGTEEKAARKVAISYMAALMRQFEPTLTTEQSIESVQKLLVQGKGSSFYAHPVGAIRYVVADNGEKGLTFAVEPIKLSLSEA